LPALQFDDSLERLGCLSALEVDGLLHIVLNGSSTRHAREVLNWLLRDRASYFGLEGTRQRVAAAKQRFQQYMSQPNVLRELLQTAAKRQQKWAVERLCEQPAAGQLSVDDVRALITCAITVSCPYEEIQCESLAALIKHLPAAQQLPVSDIVQLISQMLDEPWDYVCDGDASELDRIVQPLASLPAAQQISEQTAVKFLRESLRLGMSCVKQLQAIQQLGVDTVYNLMVEGLDHHRWACCVCLLPASYHQGHMCTHSSALPRTVKPHLAKALH
jgi:hypothetical protein